jgi:hypothetical protein
MLLQLHFIVDVSGSMHILSRSVSSKRGNAAESREDILNEGLALVNRQQFSHVHEKREVIILAEESVTASTDGNCHSGVRDVSEVHFSLPCFTLDAIEALHHALDALPHLACSRLPHTLGSRPDAVLS